MVDEDLLKDVTKYSLAAFFAVIFLLLIVLAITML